MKNEYKITRDLMMSWSKNIFGTTTIVFLIFYSIIILMSVGLLVLLALIRSNNWKLWSMSLFILVFSSYRVFFLRYYFFAKKYKILSKTYGVTECRDYDSSAIRRLMIISPPVFIKTLLWTALGKNAKPK